MLKKVLDQEIELDPIRYIVSKTDPKGFITFGNIYFVKISGYSEQELIGSPHSIIRHPDMPKTIFKLMWSNIKEGKDFCGVIKNLAKDGRFYWTMTEFNSERDPKTDEIVSLIQLIEKPLHEVLLKQLNRSIRQCWKKKKVAEWNLV